MVTGIEAAGLALAILPLVIEAAKAYDKGVQSIKKIAVAKSRDEGLHDFYEKFYWEIFSLDRSLHKIVKDLPILCYDCKISLYWDRDLEVWEQDEEVRRALEIYLGGKEALHAFSVVFMKLLDLIDRLISAKTTKLGAADRMPEQAYARLKQFVQQIDHEKTRSSFLERFRFFKSEKSRESAVRNLETWNKRLKDLLPSIVHQPVSPVITQPVLLMSEIRSVFGAMTKVVQDHWNCDCHTRHKGMVCFKRWPVRIREGTTNGAMSFVFLLPSLRASAARSLWLKATIHVQSAKKITESRTNLCPLPPDRVKLRKICEVLKEEETSELQLVIDATEQVQSLWRIRSISNRDWNINRHPSTTLYTTLSSQMQTRLRERRILAVTLAEAVLQCYETICMKDLLRLKSVHFYRTSKDEVDFTSPFIATDFCVRDNGSGSPNLGLQHSNPIILRLGILLLEVHKGRLFSTLLNESEAASTSPNRNLNAARRVVEEDLEEWCSEQYKKAIRACLEMPWVPVGAVVDLTDPVIAGGYIKCVVEPLQGELTWLFGLGN